MENIYLVVREKGDVIVSIMYSRFDDKYHFVNLTKGHICKCGFETVHEAVEDMKIKKADGEIINYIEIKDTPTVEPVKHGKWRKTGSFTCECSECNHRTVEDGANYCPNCGVKMERV